MAFAEGGLAEGFRHRALFYRGVEDLVASVVPFIRDGLERDEPVLVAEPPAQRRALEAALGPDAAWVRFVDMLDVGRNPARILPVWRRVVAERGPGARVRGVGEPVWRGRRPAELEECRLHEALLNVAFDGGPAWSLLCPYDACSLPAGVLRDAMRTHPVVGDAELSDVYEGHAHARVAFARPLSAPPPDAVTVMFGSRELTVLRVVVRRLAQVSGISPDATEELVLATHEVCTNSVMHGGGCGTLHGWRTPHSLVLEVTDAGVIDDPLVGREASASYDESGRGLWLANQLCDLVQVRSSAQGTVVRLTTWL